jgi:CHAT domain-containing protein
MTNGALQNVPFVALPYDGEETYLGDRYLIRYAPGMEYALTRNPGPVAEQKTDNTNNKLLILAPAQVEGVDELQAAKAEAEVIGNLFQTDTFFNEQVTRSLVTKEVPKYPLLHYAGHAKLDEDMPDFSHLVLAKDNSGQSSFYVNDIKKLHLQNLQLAVLSACESARTNAFNLNNEFSALNGAFLEAGAASVVASLHVVKDEITADFMKHFYQQLKNGESKARAIQLAQQYVREKHPDPDDWAAFILSGQEGYL